jgi:2-oxoisovalerate ferredoxin oxidoreductase beta subunit
MTFKNTLEKPASFQNVFTRKPGSDQANTHYCAGCGHGVVHKLIAEALSDMGLEDRAIFIAPVGCSVFLYYYFNCCAVSVPHGRAPAALTGISRAHSDAICISYQGDGDLAAIGTAEIIHAANRGEQMAVFFVNNAIYGMTGGQMAPTTLVDMKTTTSPNGRTVENDGQPIRVCEMLATLDAPVYIERVSVDSPQATMRARAAIRKALQIQDDHKGFALVEILSPCPTNWRMDSVKSNAWIREKMYPVFPLGVYRDRVDTAQPFTREHRDVTKQELYKIMDVEEESQSDSISPEHALQPLVRYKLAGFGGQGVLLLGAIIAQAGMAQGYRVTWLPSYGPEMRGGTANSSVILSSTPIGSPVVNDLDVLIALNEPSLERFLPDLQPGGVAIYDSTVIPNPPAVRDGIRLVGIPALQLAEKAGDVRATNVVLLGAYNAIAHVFDTANLNKALQEAFPKAKVLELNQRAVAAGAEFVNSSLVIPNS